MDHRKLLLDHGIPESLIAAVESRGFSASTFWTWVTTYGLPIALYLAQLFGVKIPPIPLPPAPPLPTS